MQWDRVLSGPSQACSGSSSSDRMMESEMDRYVVSSHYGVDTKKVLNKAEGLVAAAAAAAGAQKLQNLGDSSFFRTGNWL